MVRTATPMRLAANARGMASHPDIATLARRNASQPGRMSSPVTAASIGRTTPRPARISGLREQARTPASTAAATRPGARSVRALIAQVAFPPELEGEEGKDLVRQAAVAALEPREEVGHALRANDPRPPHALGMQDGRRELAQAGQEPVVDGHDEAFLRPRDERGGKVRRGGGLEDGLDFPVPDLERARQRRRQLHEIL